MIPIQLSIKGLYSYKEKQVIEFAPLISSGLFGIFGTVGSGKSSILEAIMFVLYRNTDRLTATGRNYNMMNLQSNELVIDFIFYSGDQNKDQYRVYYCSRRNSKNFDDVKVKDHCFYKLENKAWIPLPDIQDAATLTGLPFKHFMQTVIIPQGKFREFVDQTPAARTQMLKDIFHLEQYDLSIRTNQLIHECQNKISKVEGRIAELGEASEEDIIAISGEIEEKEYQLKEETDALKKLRKEEEALKGLMQLFAKINKTAETLAVLEQEKEFYESKEKQLQTYQSAYTYFKEKINQLNEITRELKTRKEKADALDKLLRQKKEASEKAAADFKAAKEATAQLDDIKEKCEDLQLIIEMKIIYTALTQLTTHYEKVKTDLDETSQQFLENKNKLKQLEHENELLEEKTSNANELNNINNWLGRKAELEKELRTAREESAAFDHRRKKIEEEKKALLNGSYDFSITLSYNDLFVKINNEKKNIKSNIEMIAGEIQPLLVKQQLADYASALAPGKPCPLCGADHHPGIAEIQSVNKEIEDKKLQVKIFSKKEDQLVKLEQQLQILHNKENNISGSQNSQLTLLQNLQAKSAKLLEEFYWQDYKEKDEQEIRKMIQENEENKKQLLALRKEFSRLKKSNDSIEGSKYEQEQKLKKIEHEKIAKESEVARMQKLLKRFDYEKFQQYALEKLKDNYTKGQQQILSINEQFEQSSKTLNALENELNHIKGNLSSEEATLTELLNKSRQMDQEVQFAIREKGFKNIRELQEILAQNLNIEAESKAITEFKQQLYSTRQAYHLLRQEASNRNYEESRHIVVIDEIENAEARIDTYKNQITLKHREVASLKEKIDSLKKLQKELGKLENRKANLSELATLFRGSGFVNYVSSIYLDDLCKAANHRFFKLTKNNLSLELSENNEFIVRDYLNNGKTRLLKTLSGGQTFQAALCLALALAEQVKSLNRSAQSFFFLDEGFGSLDRSSLQVVFETLKSLRKENRIVGIISHVEELQQEIDIYLKIKNDREQGSMVTCSWK